ncbi:hypothetical protein FSP39_015646 [Pinctada imbricata]|uniref:TROVE domain-containing protein n=1 Tax=Pinctada imbricata TaxID=66713 RepID=A0AA88Y0N2_PINIB|nr:hypothetical protein FSP39_015646 [Pinctada imbricata]
MTSLHTKSSPSSVSQTKSTGGVGRVGGSEDRKRKPGPGKVKADIKKPTVEKTKLQSSLLTSGSLHSSLLTSSSLSGPSLTGSKLTGSTLTGSNLRGSGLSGSTLTGSSLTGSKIPGSSLLGSSLSGSKLTGSALTGSSLTGSNLTGSSLTGSKLSGSGLGLSGSNLQSSSKLQSFSLQSNLLSKSTTSQPTEKSPLSSLSLRSQSAGISHASSSRLSAGSPALSSDKLLSSFTQNTSSLSTKSTLSHVKSHSTTTRSLSRGSSKEEKPKRGTKRAAQDQNVFAIKKHTIKAPKYNLENTIPHGEGVVIPDFVSPNKDPALSKIRAPLHDINGLKLALINAVSGSLICQPNFKDSKDLTRITLTGMVESVIQYDPEFILKVALFTRKQLNVRTAANFLLALSANIHPCRPYLRKYYCSSIALPSDWIEVAEIYQAFHDRNINQGSLPSALRKVMIMKFPHFDKYQLAKYNKESSMKKKKKKETAAGQDSQNVRGRGRGRGAGRGRGGYGAVRGAPAMRGARGLSKPSESLSMFSDSDSDSDDSDEHQDLMRQVRIYCCLYIYTCGGSRGGVRSTVSLNFFNDSDSRSTVSLNFFNDSDSDSDSLDDDQSLMRQISGVEYDEDKETKEELSKMRFSLKQLIRKLHITEPVEHVMCLIGKKYPSTLEAFYKARLPGTWEEERSGKRMKLPVPETWETQVSLKGNKASTWEDLIDHKKLPFMAMLRNLRNLIRAGISQKHHGLIIRRLTDERQVANSKQFPFRFFSAFEVLGQLKDEYEKSQKEIIAEAEKTAFSTTVGYKPPTRGRGRGRGKGKGTQWWMEKQGKKKEEKNKPKETAFDLGLISRYRKALDTAVKIATVYNVQPIKGRTIVLCDVGPNMEVNCTAARGLGKPRQMVEVALLMGLMCKYSCEECDLVTFGVNTWDFISIEKGTILDNLEKILFQRANPPTNATHAGTMNTKIGLPDSILNDALRDRVQIDNIVILSGGDQIHDQNQFMSAYLKKYRQLVNQNLLYVNISFAGKNCGFSQSIKPEHENDIFISGFSDAILRFIAERGEGGQLMHVEKIDEAFNLKSLATPALEKVPKPAISPEKSLPVVSNAPRWRTVRVFISSTFRDMHGERDVLTRFVFPELRALGKKHFLNIHEVDLRWGVTEEESKSNKTLELCLSEIRRCQFFIGILGSRYGYVPDKYDVPDTQEFQWLKAYPQGASVTELEMHSGALCDPKKLARNAFFFIRDPNFEDSIPKEFKDDFVSESDKQKLDSLKTRVRGSGLEVYDMYPCTWGGVVDGKPIVAGLDSFAVRVLNNLWTAIQQQYPDESAMIDDATNTNQLHKALMERHSSSFIGRKALIKECMKHIQEKTSGILVLAGKPGTGKTAFVSAFVYAYLASKSCDGPHTVMVHMVGAAPGSTNILATIKRLCYELRRQFSIDTTIPEDMKNITPKFAELLKEAGRLCSSPLLIIMDGIDMMEQAHQPHNMEWLPNPIPDNVVFVMSAIEGGKSHQALKRHKPAEVTVGGLDMFDKADVIRNNLAVYGKALDESPFNNQMKLLLSKREAVNPLFLQLACEELRVFGVFEKVGEKLKSMPHTTPLLLQEVLTRLESDLGYDTVSMAMSLLASVRDGLDMEELHELLSIKELLGAAKYSTEDVYNVKLSPDVMVPPAMFSYLQRALQAFLTPTEPGSEYRMTLAHAEIMTAVKQRYLKGMEHEQSCHKLLAGFFYQRADSGHNDTFDSGNVRAFGQLAYHLSLAGDFHILGKVLTNLHYIYNKCKLGLGAQLLEDYQERVFISKMMEREQNKTLTSVKVQEFKMFVSRQLHIINKHPALTWQQAMNEPKGSEPQGAAASLEGGLTSSRAYMEWQNKPTEVDPNYLTISNLPFPVTCVAISPDNTYFACGGLDCLVRLYSLETGKELRTYRGHADLITGVCFAGRSTLCSASLDNTISVWHVEDGHRIHLLKKHTRRVQSCASDPAGRQVASASWDCSVIVWNLAKGENVCELKVGSPVNSVAFHPEGQLIVTGSWDATIKIWDVFHKTRKAVLRGHLSSVRDVTYSPSGRHIASAALDGEVKLWAAYNGTQVGNISGHTLPINKILFTPTGKELVTVSDDHKVKVWSGHLGKPINSFGTEEDGAAKSVALSPNGEILAVGYHEGFIKLYDTLTGFKLVRVDAFESSVNCLTFMYDGAILIASTAAGQCQAFRANNQCKKIAEYGYNTKAILCSAVTRSYLAIGMEDCSAQIFVIPKDHASLQQKNPAKADVTLRGQVGPISSVTFSPDASKLATASRDSSVYIWDIYGSMIGSNPEPITKLHACHKDWITDCKWSNTGEYLVTSSTDFNLKIWDIKTGSEKTRLTGHMASINHIAYSYGCIVSTCSDGSVKIWSHKGTEITTLYGHSQCANGCDLLVRVSKESEVEKEPDLSDWSAEPDQTEEKSAKESKKQIKVEDVIVATCSDDGTARLWRPLQANELANLTGHSDRVISVAADTHGNICTTSLDKSVKLWKPELKPDRTQHGHNAEITFCVCSPHKDVLLTGSRDGVLKIWDLVSPEMASLEVKAHTKSINTACFLEAFAKVFTIVTGGNDCKIIYWNFSVIQGQFKSFSKGRVNSTESPVTCLIKKEMSQTSDLFFSCEWNGNIKVWKSNDIKSSARSSRDVSKSTGNWLMKMISPGQHPKLFATTSNKTVYQINLQAQKGGDVSMSVGNVTEIPNFLDIKNNIPEHKRQNNMILDVAQYMDVFDLLFMADSAGQVSVTGSDKLSVKGKLKIHASAVTSIQFHGTLMFTGSKDHTVKVWQVIDKHLTKPIINLEVALQQVGLFYCPAPVTSLQVIHTDCNSVRLACGDQLGNIHFLSWNTI